MEILLNTEFKPVSFKYIIACWKNECNPAVKLGCVIVQPGKWQKVLSGFGPNGTYIFDFYASDNGISLDMHLDTKLVRTGAVEVNYASV